MRAAAAALCAAGTAAGADPFGPGAYNVTSFAVKVPVDEPPVYSYAVYAPDAPAPFPVVAFVAGCGQLLWQEVAARGVIVVDLTEPTGFGMNFTKITDGLSVAMDYMAANLTAQMRAHGMSASPAGGQLALGAHSSGNHVTMRFLRDFGCRGVGAVLLFDPYDGADPFGMIEKPALTDGTPAPFSAPALHLETGWDHVKDVVGVPCAPPKISNDHFYNVWTGPIWKVNATDYDHESICDAGFPGYNSCPHRKPRPDQPPFLRGVAGLISAFLGMVFGGDDTQLATLEAPGALPFAATGKHAYNGRAAPFRAYCARP